MTFKPKEDGDWPAARAAWEGGASFAQAGKAGRLSKSAVAKRAHEDGWERGVRASTSARSPSTTGAQAIAALTGDVIPPSNRDEAGHFLPGNRANPLGRGRRDMELAQGYVDKAIRTLDRVMDSDKATATAKVAAANSMLDRAYGRPVSVVVNVDPEGQAKTSGPGEYFFTKFKELVAGVLAAQGHNTSGPDASKS